MQNDFRPQSTTHVTWKTQRLQTHWSNWIDSMVGVEWGFGVFEFILHMYSPLLSEGINYRGQRGSIADKQPSETWVTTAHCGTALECCWLGFAGDKICACVAALTSDSDEAALSTQIVQWFHFFLKESLMVIFRVQPSEVCPSCVLYTVTPTPQKTCYMYIYSTVQWWITRNGSIFKFNILQFLIFQWMT